MSYGIDLQAVVAVDLPYHVAELVTMLECECHVEVCAHSSSVNVHVLVPSNQKLEV